MTATTARPIRFAIDGIEVGSAKLYGGILIDTSARWSKDPDVVVAVHYRIEAAIRRNHNGVSYVNDSGERVAISWEIEQ
jgi:hypothetical protein